jgi:hypothetical protein
MADDHFEAFRRLVLRSPALQEQLRAEQDVRTFEWSVVARRLGPTGTLRCNANRR